MQKKMEEIIKNYIELTRNLEWEEEISLDDYLKIRNQAIQELKDKKLKSIGTKSSVPTRIISEEEIPTKITHKTAGIPPVSEKNTVIAFETKKEAYGIDNEEDEELDELAILASLGND